MDNSETIKKYLKAFLQVAFILAIGVGSIWVASLVTGGKDKPSEIAEEVVKEVILKRPACPDTSESFAQLKDSGQIVTLARDLNSYGGTNGDFVNKKFTVVKSIGSGSQIACGYLYIKAHVGNRALQRQWEHAYVRPGQFGGHIVIENAIVDQDIENKSEFLFNLSKINYRESVGATEIRKADWAALLNVTDRITFEVALNTTDLNGVMDEASIVYQCWNPETGKITHDCRLEVE